MTSNQYEGMLVGFKLLTPTDTEPTFLAINDMYGNYKISSVDNKFYSKINVDQSSKNSVSSVWHLADDSL